MNTKLLGGVRTDHTLTPAEHEEAKALNIPLDFGVLDPRTTIPNALAFWARICTARGLNVMTVNFPVVAEPDFSAVAL